MDVRVITLRYQEGMQGFPEGALRQAIAGRDVLEAREHFFTHGNVPHLFTNNNNGLRPASALRQDAQANALPGRLQATTLDYGRCPSRGGRGPSVVVGGSRPKERP
jgi:hypothetical protein